MASVIAGFGQLEKCNAVMFKLLDTSGTPTIIEVFPKTMASNISVVDTAAGRATVTVANFKGDSGFARIFLDSETTSLSKNAVTRSFSGNDLIFEISVEDDASTLTDASVDVLCFSY